MRRILTVFLAACLSLAASAEAQTLQMGNLIGSPNDNDLAVADVRTEIDLVNPATASGLIESATFAWSAAGCPAAAKIKIFRRQAGTLVFLAERGPFDVPASPTTVDLIPSIEVEQGDLIGITRLTTCGNPESLTGIVTAGYLAYAGDLTANVAVSAGAAGPGVLAVAAAGVAVESIYAVLPVAGSTPGGFGSFFRTGVQLSNPNFGQATGRFVFHPAGVSGSSSDPTLDFTVAPLSTISYADVVETMGQSGLGTLDLVLPNLGAVPLVVARVFNDAGPDGTSGLTEEAIPLHGDDRVLFAGATGLLVAPADPAHFRFNIGIRTLLSGAVLTLRLRDANGVVKTSVTLQYDPTFFVQTPAETLLGAPLAANDSIEVSVSSGSAVVYGATADNVTNDPSIQFVRVIFAIAELLGSSDGATG